MRARGVRFSASFVAMERWNTHFSDHVRVDAFGCSFDLKQDPNSMDLGTTVWDASIVWTKYVEKQSAKRGEFATSRLRGKRVLELGAGMGLGGIAMCALGCDVVLTDRKEVLGLLQNNVDKNVPRRTPGNAVPSCLSADKEHFGHATVRPLHWGNQEELLALNPPFDYVLCTDCVYQEDLCRLLVDTIVGAITKKSKVYVVNEHRSQSVQDAFVKCVEERFHVRKVPHSKMDPVHQHPSIDIYVLQCKSKPGVPPQ